MGGDVLEEGDVETLGAGCREVFEGGVGEGGADAEGRWFSHWLGAGGL